MLYNNTVDATGEVASDVLITKQMAFPMETFTHSGSGNLKLLNLEEELIPDALSGWLRSE